LAEYRQRQQGGQENGLDLHEGCSFFFINVRALLHHERLREMLGARGDGMIGLDQPSMNRLEFDPAEGQVPVTDRMKESHSPQNLHAGKLIGAKIQTFLSLALR
jgi:hypothetical protein